MSWFRRRAYERAYRAGRARWDTGVTPPEVVDLIEGSPPLPPGSALDLGCGTGTNALYLARHGWEVVGVDFSEPAIEAATTKAEGVAAVRFVQGDVTRLEALGIDGPFDLVLDIGCFHSVSLRRRRAYARGTARVAKPGAVLTIFAWGPAWARPKSWRTREGEIRRRFGDAFALERTIPGREPPGAAWFVLRRRRGVHAPA
jgi:SAM-dependent methyltransferase